MAQQQQPQKNQDSGNVKKNISPNQDVTPNTQKADIRRPSEREYETEDGSPEAPFKPEVPDREVPDLRAERDSSRQ